MNGFLTSHCRFPFYLLITSHLSTAVTPTTLLDVADPFVNKTESLVSGQKIDLLVKACTQASSEQPNSVATDEGLTKHTDEIGLLESAVRQQGQSDKPVGVSASSRVNEKTVSSLEMPNASSEEPTANKRAVPGEEQTKEMAVGSKKFIDQKSEHSPVQLRILEDKPGPVHGSPKDVNKTSVAVETLEFSCTKNNKNLCTSFNLMSSCHII